MSRVMIHVPPTARVDEVVEIRAMVSHPMETGYRVDATGERIPRNILDRFTCSFEGEVILAADLFPAIAANPFVAFSMRARRSGTLTFRWTGDGGSEITATAQLTVAE